MVVSFQSAEALKAMGFCKPTASHYDKKHEKEAPFEASHPMNWNDGALNADYLSAPEIIEAAAFLNKNGWGAQVRQVSTKAYRFAKNRTVRIQQPPTYSIGIAGGIREYCNFKSIEDAYDYAIAHSISLPRLKPINQLPALGTVRQNVSKVVDLKAGLRLMQAVLERDYAQEAKLIDKIVAQEDRIGKMLSDLKLDVNLNIYKK